MLHRGPRWVLAALSESIGRWRNPAWCRPVDVEVPRRRADEAVCTPLDLVPNDEPEAFQAAKSLGDPRRPSEFGVVRVERGADEDRLPPEAALVVGEVPQAGEQECGFRGYDGDRVVRPEVRLERADPHQ